MKLIDLLEKQKELQETIKGTPPTTESMLAFILNECGKLTQLLQFEPPQWENKSPNRKEVLVQCADILMCTLALLIIEGYTPQDYSCTWEQGWKDDPTVWINPWCGFIYFLGHLNDGEYFSATYSLAYAFSTLGLTQEEVENAYLGFYC